MDVNHTVKAVVIGQAVPGVIALGRMTVFTVLASRQGCGSFTVINCNLGITANGMAGETVVRVTGQRSGVQLQPGCR